MNRLVTLFIVGLLVSSVVFAQSDDVAKLNQQVASLYQQGKFDEAIPMAEKVVAVEKKASKNSEAHANSLMNLAQLHKEKARFLKTNLSKFEPNKRYGAFVAARDAADDAKKLFRESLEIFNNLKLDQTATVASLKNELAWAVYNFYVSDSIGESRAQIDDAERLYAEAVVTADSLSPANPDLQMSIRQNFADFYMRYVNFEKAFPLYERNVQIAEAKYGPKGQQLLGGLRALNEIYLITDREADSNSMLERIADITGSVEKPVIKFPLLDARSRGFGKVKTGDFIHRDYSDLDRSFRTTAEIQRMVAPAQSSTLKYVEVDILVDEEGNVIEANVSTPSKYAKDVREAAMASKFRPFEYNGKRQKLRGKINFTYKD